MNYFILELDTTGPHLSIIAPQYTTRFSYTEIIVEADEDLLEYQDIYLIDSSGVRHDFILQHQGTSYKGLVLLPEASVGIATIYARLKDSVENNSDTAIHVIEILSSGEYSVSMSETVRELHSDVFARELNIDTSTRLFSSEADVRSLDIDEQIRELQTSEAIREIEVKQE